MVNFFIQVAQATLIQIVSIFGIFFVLGFLLSKIQAAILKNYSRSIGWRGLLWTAWLGTPVHEYSHALLAVIFGHKITEVVLFSPDPNTGELGHVSHSYNQRSFYQSVGNFFIGLAPLIIGPLILIVLLYVLVPQGREVFAQLSYHQNSLALLGDGVKQFLILLFSPANLTSYRFWIFLYISFCIASHLAPSQSDRRGAWHGSLVIIFWLIFINILAQLASFDITSRIVSLSRFFTELVTVYIYTLIISLIHWFISYLILRPWRRS